MLNRTCAGGIVFYRDTVFIIQNDKGDWALPKGVIRGDNEAEHVALDRVKVEGGIDASILSHAGVTSYEFYSTSRKQPVCNEITWYIMQADSPNYEINDGEGFSGGGFFPVDDAIDMITYSQDKSLLRMAAEKYKKIREI